MLKLIGKKLKGLLGERKEDSVFFEELEEILIEGDFGATLAFKFVEELKREIERKDLNDKGYLLSRMKELLADK